MRTGGGEQDHDRSEEHYGATGLRIVWRRVDAAIGGTMRIDSRGVARRMRAESPSLSTYSTLD